MRVAIAAETFLPHVSGVTGSVVRVLRHLRDTGHEALVLAPGDPPATCEGARVVALPSVPLPGYPEVRLPIATAGAVAAQLAEFRPDVLHLASPFALGGPAVRAAARVGVPVVAVYQTDVAGFATRYGAGSVANVAWHRVRSIHERANLTLAPSSAAAADLRRHGIPRVRLWPRGVDTVAFSPAHRDDLLRRRLAPDGQVLVGFLGRLAAEKQVEDLRSLMTLPGVRVVVIGDGPERDRLRRVLRRSIVSGAPDGHCACPARSRPSTSPFSPALMRPSAKRSRRPWPAVSLSSPLARAAPPSWSTTVERDGSTHRATSRA